MFGIIWGNVMKKIFSLAILFSLVSVSVWAGHWADMRTKACGGANEYYRLDNSGRYCLECDDDSGDAPAKTRVYWADSGNVYSRKCFISPNLTGDDRWMDRESVSQCAGKCNAPKQKIPDTDSLYICGKINLAIKSWHDSVLVQGGSLDDIDCYYIGCGPDEPLGTKKDLDKCSAENDPSATKCEQICVLESPNSKKAVWKTYVKECKDGMTPGGFNEYGYTKCEGGNGSVNPGGGNPGGGNPGGGNPGGGSSNVSGSCGNEIRTTDTAGRGAYIVHWYRVKGWKGTYPGNGMNDFNCTVAGKHLDVYEENGTWYTTGKCVSESKRPGCTQAYPEGQAPGSGQNATSQKNCEDSYGTWANGVCVCDANKNLIKDPNAFCVCKDADHVLVPASKSCEMTYTAKAKLLCEAAAVSGAVWNGVECACSEVNKEWNGASCVVSVAYEQCKNILDATWNTVKKQCVCNDANKIVNNAGTKCVETPQTVATRKIGGALEDLRAFVADLEVSKWKDAEGNFNTARLASDLTAGVVLGTAGALITSSVVKKNQVENGFEDISCTIGGQTVADWGDEFTVGVH